MNYKAKRKLACLAAALTFPVGVLAQNYSELEDVLVTGTFSQQSQITSTNSVLNSPEIRALNKRTIAGLLKTMPGLLVEEGGGPGGLSVVSIRGAESNFTLVLLDGIPVSDPTNSRGGGYDFANLSAALVERIEVVRGAQSAIYGSDALAGVINIITRRSEEGHTQQVYAEWGEDDFADLNFSARGILNELQYAVEIASRDEGEPVEGSTRQFDRTNVSLAWRLTDTHDVTAVYNHLDGERTHYPEQSGGPDFALFDDVDESDYEDSVYALSWQAKFTPRWKSKLTGSRFVHQDKLFSPGIYPFSEVPLNVSDTEFKRSRIQWVNTIGSGRSYEFDIGADYQEEEGQSIGYVEFGPDQIPTDFEMNRSSAGLFAGISIGVLNSLLLQGAVRYDDPDEFDGETSLHLGARYTLQQNFALTANWGEAYKLPSFFALGHALVGNPDLLPERSRNWDIGLAWIAAEELHLEATFFLNEFEDLIDFDDQLFTNVNRQKVEARGVELQTTWSLRDSVTFRAQATYTDIEVKHSASQLTGRPEWVAGGALNWEINQHWSSSLDYRWTGQQYAASRHTGEAVVTELDDFHKIDWVLRWAPLENIELQLSVDNLLDEDYQTAVGFPAPGSSIRLGIRLMSN